MENWIIMVIIISFFTLIFTLPFLFFVRILKKNPYDLSKNKNYQWYPHSGWIYNFFKRFSPYN